MDALEVVEVASEEVLEKVVDFFFGTNPILSSSPDWSKLGIEGLRNNPFTEARGFSGLEERVLLLGLIVGAFEVVLSGLGDLCCVEETKPGDGSLEVALEAWAVRFRLVDGVLRLEVLRRFKGVCAWEADLGALKVFVDARKSTGLGCPWPALDVGLEVRDGGLIDASL